MFRKSIETREPWQNGLNESFNGKLRDECLSLEWFKNRIDAKILIEEFRRGSNEIRPHSSPGQLTPAEIKQTLSQTHPAGAIFQSQNGPKKAGRPIVLFRGSRSHLQPDRLARVVEESSHPEFQI